MNQVLNQPIKVNTDDHSVTEYTEAQVYDALRTVIDPELNVDIVSLGLVYGVEIIQMQKPHGLVNQVHVIMTLTTPGCPLAAVFDTMVKEGLRLLPGLNVDEDASVELVFDPPWVPDMMSAEAKAELGFD
jgi:metal-sulfur cluster biosynthetic enzyme